MGEMVATTPFREFTTVAIYELNQCNHLLVGCAYAAGQVAYLEQTNANISLIINKAGQTIVFLTSDNPIVSHICQSDIRHSKSLNNPIAVVQ